jgi:hypothetical protein
MAEVDAILSRATQLADRFAKDADRVLSGAVTIASGGVTLIPPNIGEIGDFPDLELNFNIPVFNDSYHAPALNVDKPNYEDVHAIGDAQYPSPIALDFNGLFKQQKPDTGRIGSFNKQAPDLDIDGLSTEINSIPRPTVSDIDEPLLSEVTVGTAPSVDIPEFSPTVTLQTVADPVDLNAEYESAYDRTLPVMQGFIVDTVNEWYACYAPDLKNGLARLATKIEEGVASGRALTDEFETALFNRARTRAEDEGDRSHDELVRNVSKRGFDLPPAILNAGRVQIQQATSRNIAEQAMALAIERAKMEIQHVQFSMSLSQNYHQALINSALQYASTLSDVNNQALEYARQVAANVGKLYELTLANVRLNIDILNAQARVYETELKAAFAVYEEFRLELETAKLAIDIDSQKVQLYTARLDGQTTKIQQYIAILDSIDKRAGLEKLKAELYGEEVKAYLANLSSIESETRIYTATLTGDEALLQAELSKFDVYAKEVEVAKDKQQLKIARMKLLTDVNNNKTDIYKAELERYKTEVGASTKEFEGGVKAHGAQLDSVKTEILAKSEVYKADYNAIVAKSQAARDQLIADLEIQKANAEAFLSRIDIQTKTGIEAGNVYGGMARAMLDSQNTMVSLVEQKTSS